MADERTSFSWDEGRREVAEKDSSVDTRVEVSLGADQKEVQVLRSALRSSLGGEKSV